MNPIITGTSTSYDTPIIIALDYDNEAQVMELIQKLDPSLCKLKVGKELFTACGPKLVEKLTLSGYKVFLDLKFHDIPNTVYKACKAACNLGVWMLNVHASGGLSMLKQAKTAVAEAGTDTLLIAVTVLTSLNQADLSEVGIVNDTNTQVISLAKLSYTASLDGVVCSALEAKELKKATSDNFLTICPGIRLTTNANEIADDQKRIMTPPLALKNGADYLVIGRPITQAKDPYNELVNILSSLEQ